MNQQLIFFFFPPGNVSMKICELMCESVLVFCFYEKVRGKNTIICKLARGPLKSTITGVMGCYIKQVYDSFKVKKKSYTLNISISVVYPWSMGKVYKK